MNAVASSRTDLLRRSASLAVAVAIGAGAAVAAPAQAHAAPTTHPAAPTAHSDAALRLAMAQPVLTSHARSAQPRAARLTAAGEQYKVRSGDTLSGIAKRHRVSVPALREANGINGARIYAGQTLRIPGGSAPAATQQVAAKQKKPQAARSYRVRAGDTLSHIAARHATTVDALRKANRINGSRVVVGQTLTLPGNPAAKPKTASQRRQAGSSSGRQAAPGTDYRVKQADTLSDIAKAHGISVQQIRAANPKLTSNRIIAGSTIKIPGGSQPSRNEHRVGNTFAGRSYAPEVTRAAQRNKNTLMSRQVPGRDQMRSIIRNAAVAHGVDPKLALAVAYHESGFNMQAVSPANAVGAMQVIPSSVNWASSMAGRKLDALNPQDNATAGVLVLKSVIGATDNEDDAIAAYYQGLSSVRKNGMYADTKKYVANVKALKSRF